MKFSSNFLIYPANKALGRAIDHYINLFPEQAQETAAPDNRQVLQDNFIHTQGNFELHRYAHTLLENAREAFKSSLSETAREQFPLDWAAVQNSLGNILAALGQQQDSDDWYTLSIQAFNDALEVYSQEQTPQEWAWTNYSLGTATHALGKKQGEAKLLKAAVDACTRALLVWTRQDAPLEWALTMHQLGGALHSHGKLLKGNRTLQKSVVAYKNALAELDADNAGLELVATHNNRGTVLHNLAESEENPDRIEEALRSYELALDASMEQQLSIHLAVICRINKATARCVLAELRKESAIAEEAADELEVIIECFHGACQPQYTARCEQELVRARSMVERFRENAVETGQPAG